MNGPEHYREAERLLVSCQIDLGEFEVYPQVGGGAEDGVDSCRNALMAAQVHATLALAAATIHPAIANRDGVKADELHWALATSPSAVTA